MPSAVYILSTERGNIVRTTEEHIIEGHRWKQLELFCKQQPMLNQSCDITSLDESGLIYYEVCNITYPFHVFK
jgi:hypothetical protein